jgi:hypothetical protein
MKVVEVERQLDDGDTAQSRSVKADAFKMTWQSLLTQPQMSNQKTRLNHFPAVESAVDHPKGWQQHPLKAECIDRLQILHQS